MLDKIKELIKSKKTILMLLMIAAAVTGALTDVCTGAEALKIICAAIGMNAVGVGLQDVGKETTKMAIADKNQ